MSLVQTMDELDLSTFIFGGVNLTGFRLVDRKGVSYEETQTEWEKVVKGTHLRSKLTVRAHSIQFSILKIL